MRRGYLPAPAGQKPPRARPSRNARSSCRASLFLASIRLGWALFDPKRVLHRLCVTIHLLVVSPAGSDLSRLLVATLVSSNLAVERRTPRDCVMSTLKREKFLRFPCVVEPSNPTTPLSR
jgi:hypothetical protein